MGITDEASNLLSWNFFVMVTAYDRCSYVNPLFIFKFFYLSFIIFREKCVWQRYILSLRDAKLRRLFGIIASRGNFYWGCHPLQSFSLCILISVVYKVYKVLLIFKSVIFRLIQTAWFFFKTLSFIIPLFENSEKFFSPFQISLSK